MTEILGWCYYLSDYHLFAKSSILLLYYRVFKVDRMIRYGVWTGIIFQGFSYSAAVGLGIGSMCKCDDISEISDQFCDRIKREIQVMILVVNIVTDIYVLILPLYRVSKLQLKSKRKVGLLLVFAEGVV